MTPPKHTYVLCLALCAGAAFQLAGQVTPVPGVAPPKVGTNATISATSAAVQRSRQDPASVARGSTLFVANCGFCHGATAKGTDIGPDLMRSKIVVDDDKGELLFPKVRNHTDKAAISASLTDTQLADIDAWLKVQYYGIANRNTYEYLQLVLGDAKKGEALFNAKCSSCHSVTGDLAGIGGRTEPHALQSLWISGGGGGRGGGGGGRGRGAVAATGAAGAAAAGRGAAGGRAGRGGGRGGGGEVAAAAGTGGDPGSTVLDETPPVIGKATPTITVTLADGTKIDGVAMGVNDFTVAMKDMQGKYHSWTKIGDFPKVVTHNPLQAHGDILRSLNDDDMHNITAYLVTIK